MVQKHQWFKKLLTGLRAKLAIAVLTVVQPILLGGCHFYAKHCCLLHTRNFAAANNALPFPQQYPSQLVGREAMDRCFCSPPV